MEPFGWFNIGKSIANFATFNAPNANIYNGTSLILQTCSWQNLKEIEIVQSCDDLHLIKSSDTEYSCLIGSKLVKQGILVYTHSDLNIAMSMYAQIKENMLPIYRFHQSELQIDTLRECFETCFAHSTWTTCHIAAKFGFLKFIQTLSKDESLKRSPSSGTTPFHIACRFGNVDIVEEFIKLGIDPTECNTRGNNALHFAVQQNSSKCILVLGKMVPQLVNEYNEKGHTPLHVATQLEHDQAVEALCYISGIDIYLPTLTRRIMAIHIASFTGNVACLNHLAKLDGDYINLPDESSGQRPIHCVSSRNVIVLMSELKADLNAKDNDGNTAIHCLASTDNLECCLELLIQNVDVGPRNCTGETPLHLASKVGQLDIVRVLLVFGADVNAEDDNGDTSRHLVVSLQPPDWGILLFNLSAVGARRCVEGKEGCSSGCSHDGYYNGSGSLTYTLLIENMINEVEFATKYQASVMAGRKRGEPDMESILCLDGGGIKGLSLILLMRTLEEKSKMKLTDLFDWFGGTSTGGILALCLAKGLSLRECINMYFGLKNTVFTGMRPYSPQLFEEILKKTFGDRTMSSIKSPNVVVTSVLGDRFPCQLHLFRNYYQLSEQSPVNSFEEFSSPLGPDLQPVWLVARATGAAPSVFPSVDQFLDGGLISNNPTMDVVSEVINHHKELYETKNERKRIGIVVSFGTGQPPTTNIDTPNIELPSGVLDITGHSSLFGSAKDLGMMLIDQCTQSGGSIVERARALCYAMGVPYFRISPLRSCVTAVDTNDDLALLQMLWETLVYLHVNQNVFDDFIDVLFDCKHIDPK